MQRLTPRAVENARGEAISQTKTNDRSDEEYLLVSEEQEDAFSQPVYELFPHRPRVGIQLTPPRGTSRGRCRRRPSSGDVTGLPVRRRSPGRSRPGRHRVRIQRCGPSSDCRRRGLSSRRRVREAIADPSPSSWRTSPLGDDLCPSSSNSRLTEPTGFALSHTSLRDALQTTCTDYIGYSRCRRTGWLYRSR